MVKQPRFHDGKSGAAVTVRLVPGAKRTEISEILEDGTLSIDITGAQVEGDANLRLLKFLAGVLAVGPEQLDVIAGNAGQNKLISIIGLDADSVQARINAYQGR